MIFCCGLKIFLLLHNHGVVFPHPGGHNTKKKLKAKKFFFFLIKKPFGLHKMAHYQEYVCVRNLNESYCVSRNTTIAFMTLLPAAAIYILFQTNLSTYINQHNVQIYT